MAEDVQESGLKDSEGVVEGLGVVDGDTERRRNSEGDPSAEFDRFMAAQGERVIERRVASHEEKLGIRGQMESLRGDSNAGISMLYYKDLEESPPDRYDLSTVDELVRGDVGRRLFIIRRYIESPAIMDGFTDHMRERRPWRLGLLSGLRKVYEYNNRLRHNRINQVREAMIDIATFLDSSDVRKGVIDALAGSIVVDERLDVEDLGRVDMITGEALATLRLFEDMRGGQERTSG